MTEWRCPLLAAAVLAILICAAGCGEADAPVARINNLPIMRSELERFIKVMELCNPEAAPLRENGPPGCCERELLHLLIGFELVNQAAVKAGMDAGPEMMEGRIEHMLQELVETRYGGSREKFHRRRKQLGLALHDLAILPRYELQAEALFKELAPAVEETELLDYIKDKPGMLVQPAAGELYRIAFAEKEKAEECLAVLQRGVRVEGIAAERDLDFTNRGWIAENDPFLEKGVREELFTTLEKERGCIIGSPGQYFLYWVQQIRPARQLDLAEIREEAAQLKKCLLYEQFYYDLWKEGDIEIYLRPSGECIKEPAGINTNFRTESYCLELHKGGNNVESNRYCQAHR